MYKFLGNYKIDFDIKLDELNFNSHKIYSHNDKDSNKANSVEKPSLKAYWYLYKVNQTF